MMTVLEDSGWKFSGRTNKFSLVEKATLVPCFFIPLQLKCFCLSFLIRQRAKNRSFSSLSSLLTPINSKNIMNNNHNNVLINVLLWKTCPSYFFPFARSTKRLWEATEKQKERKKIIKPLGKFLCLTYLFAAQTKRALKQQKKKKKLWMQERQKVRKSNFVKKSGKNSESTIEKAFWCENTINF